MGERLKGIVPSDLSPQQLQLYDAITGSPRSKGVRAVPLVSDDGILQGPFNSMLLSPEVGFALQELGSKVRYSENLSPLEREIAILTVAAHMGSDYEIQVHTRAARLAGLSESNITNICEQELPAEVSSVGKLAWRVARELVSTGKLSDELWELATSSITLAGLYDLVVIVGYYQILAMTMAVFD